MEQQSRHYNGIQCLTVFRFIEIQSKFRRKKFHTTNQSSDSFGGGFSYRDNLRAPMQFRKESQLHNLNPIQDGLFRGCSPMGRRGGFLAPLPKIPHTYPTMMKLGTIVPYLRKIQKMYKSRDTTLEFC